MKRLWVVWAGGALLITVSAAIRNVRATSLKPVPSTLTISNPPQPAEEIEGDPASSDAPWTPLKALREWKEQALTALPEPHERDYRSIQAIDDSSVSSHVSMGFVSIRFADDQGVQMFTLSAVTLSETQEHQLDFWIAWRKQAIDALPEDLRADSEHRKAIDETYRSGIRAFLSEEELASAGEGTESLVSGGIALSALLANSRVTLDQLREQERQVIDNLRAAAESRVNGGLAFVTRLQAPQEVYDLRAATTNQSLLRFTPSWLSERQLIVESLDGAAPDPPPDPHQQALNFWSDWKNQAIAALPESLRENSVYQAAIEAQYQAALLSLGVTPHPAAPASVGVSKMD